MTYRTVKTINIRKETTADDNHEKSEKNTFFMKP